MSARQELEMLVTACNTPLRGHVKHMSNVILLRNVYPGFRHDSAKRLLDEGKLSRQQAEEFTRVPEWNIKRTNY